MCACVWVCVCLLIRWTLKHRAFSSILHMRTQICFPLATPTHIWKMTRDCIINKKNHSTRTDWEYNMYIIPYTFKKKVLFYSLVCPYVAWKYECRSVAAFGNWNELRVLKTRTYVKWAHCTMHIINDTLTLSSHYLLQSFPAPTIRNIFAAMFSCCYCHYYCCFISVIIICTLSEANEVQVGFFIRWTGKFQVYEVMTNTDVVKKSVLSHILTIMYLFINIEFLMNFFLDSTYIIYVQSHFWPTYEY